jgi:HK97 family phage portal protein
VHPSKVAGTATGLESALRLQPVYSSVRILAEGVAQTPLQQYRDAGERKLKMPLGQLLSKPSAYQNRFDWLFQFVSSAALTGTAWGLITARDGYGLPTTIEWLPPDKMHVIESQPFNPALARIFYEGKPVSRDELFLVRAFTVPGCTAGISPLRNFQMLIEAGIDALGYGADWYKSGGFPPGTFQNTQWEVDDEQASKIKAQLVRAQRRREPLVYGRDWEYKPVAVPPNEAQFVEAMQLNATQIASVYGVPPHRVGGVRGDSMTYTNVEAEGIAMIADTLDPWLVRLETALDDVLPALQTAVFNRNSRNRTDITTRFNSYRAARDIGLMNVDEIRAIEDLPPLPKPTDPSDYDGTDYTPLQIQVAAARGLKELVGEGTTGQPLSNPANLPRRPVPGQLPVAPGPAQQAPAPGQSQQVPAVNGNGRPRRREKGGGEG